MYKGLMLMKILGIFLITFLSMSMMAADKTPKIPKKGKHRCAKGEKQVIANALNKLTKQGQCKTSMRKQDIDQLFEEQLSPRTPKP